MTAVEVVSWRNSTPGSLVDIEIPEPPLGSNALAECDPHFWSPQGLPGGEKHLGRAATALKQFWSLRR